MNRNRLMAAFCTLAFFIATGCSDKNQNPAPTPPPPPGVNPDPRTTNPNYNQPYGQPQGDPNGPGSLPPGANPNGAGGFPPGANPNGAGGFPPGANPNGPGGFPPGPNANGPGGFAPGVNPNDPGVLPPDPLVGPNGQFPQYTFDPSRPLPPATQLPPLPPQQPQPQALPPSQGALMTHVYYYVRGLRSQVNGAPLFTAHEARAEAYWILSNRIDLAAYHESLYHFRNLRSQHGTYLFPGRRYPAMVRYIYACRRDFRYVHFRNAYYDVCRNQWALNYRDRVRCGLLQAGISVEWGGDIYID